MTLISQSRKHYSELFKGTVPFEGLDYLDYYIAEVDVSSEEEQSIDPVGTPLIWNGESMVVYNQFFPINDVAVTDSALPDGALVAVTIGTSDALGVNQRDVTLSETPTRMLVLFRGPVGIALDGLEIPDDENLVNQFRTFLEKQGINVVESAETVDPRYLS